MGPNNLAHGRESTTRDRGVRLSDGGVSELSSKRSSRASNRVRGLDKSTLFSSSDAPNEAVQAGSRTDAASTAARPRKCEKRTTAHELLGEVVADPRGFALARGA